MISTFDTNTIYEALESVTATLSELDTMEIFYVWVVMGFFDRTMVAWSDISWTSKIRTCLSKTRHNVLSFKSFKIINHDQFMALTLFDSNSKVIKTLLLFDLFWRQKYSNEACFILMHKRVFVSPFCLMRRETPSVQIV